MTILAVGRLRAGPEAELVADYLARFDRTGRPLGLGPAQVVELEDRRGGGPAAEAPLLAAALPKGARSPPSTSAGAGSILPASPSILRRAADSGVRDLAFAIGGPDGLDPAFRDRRRPRHLASEPWSGRTCSRG